MGGRARKPKATAEENAASRRQSRELDSQIGKSERKFKALARGKLGVKSLLGGPKHVEEKKSSPLSAPKPPKLKKPRAARAQDPNDEGGR